MTTLVHGGTVVSSTGAIRQDVLVDGEKIVALLAPGSKALGVDLAAAVDVVIDATGKYVIPGGIDAHTHMEMPFGGTTASDSFETGTRAAAWGGTTTIVDFVVQSHGQRVLDTVASWHAKAAGNCAIDYGFHQIVGDVNDESLASMDALIDEGITSFKLFMAYPGVYLSSDGQILQAMQQAAGNGGLIMMHAENGSAIDVLVQQALARGETSPYYHGVTRPWQAEQEATHRAIMLADITGAPLYVVHVSAKQALARIAEARNTGQNVFAETCPQYLYLSLEENLGAPGFEGAKWVCSTPLRSRAEGHQRLDGSLPVLHEGPEGDGDRQLLQDPQRHRVRRASDGSALPGCRRQEDQPGALGRGLLHHAGSDVRDVSAEGRHRPGFRRRHRHLRPGRPHLDRPGQDPPHADGLLRLGGLGDRRPCRHRDVPGQGHRGRERVPGPGRRRPVRQAAALAEPDLSAVTDPGGT
jgi:dihydroorotase-like cyclic amidohydrolase